MNGDLNVSTINGNQKVRRAEILIEIMQFKQMSRIFSWRY